MAQAFGITTVPHCAYFGSGYLATLHVVAAMPDDTLHERLFLDFPNSPFARFSTVNEAQSPRRKDRAWAAIQLLNGSQAHDVRSLLWRRNRK
jgi:hypothetical protein